VAFLREDFPGGGCEPELDLLLGEARELHLDDPAEALGLERLVGDDFVSDAKGDAILGFATSGVAPATSQDRWSVRPVRGPTIGPPRELPGRRAHVPSAPLERFRASRRALPAHRTLHSTISSEFPLEACQLNVTVAPDAL